MGTAPTSAFARAATAVAGSVALVGTAALVGPIRTSAVYDTTYADVSSALALLLVAVGAGLLAAAFVLLLDRSTLLLGVLVVAASTTWLAPMWIGWEGGPHVVRGIGLVLAPLLPALVLAVTSLVALPSSKVLRAAVAALACAAILATIAASVALALVRQPLRDLHCWSDCTAGAFVVWDDPVLARRLTEVVLVLGAASGVVAALIALLRLATAERVARRAAGPALAAAALTAGALAAYSSTLRFGPSERPSRPLYEALFVARGLGLIALAAALVWLAVRPRLVRAHVRRLALDFERSAAEGGLGAVLAQALGDPELRLVYPIGKDGRLVDADGRPAELRSSGRVTPLVGRDGVVALVESEATQAQALERELGPAAQVAVENERLRAEALARLTDVTASRARIVETADAARQRMERDLHDGAQQRMLALTYDLRVALAIAGAGENGPAVEPLRHALERAVAASEELRDLAHGIFPAELAASGLEAALESLADVRPLRLRVTLPAHRRYAPDAESTAYALVAEAVEVAADAIDVFADERDGVLRVSVEGVDAWGDRLVHVEDRAAAAGGELTVSQRRVELVLPNARTAAPAQA